MRQFQWHVVGGGVNHLGGRRGGVGCGFSGPGGPCGERNTAFDSTLCCFLVVLEGEGEGEGGFQFRRWRVGGGQNRHAGLKSGCGRASGRHRADRGAARWGGAASLEERKGLLSLLPSGHPGVPLRDSLRMRWMIRPYGGCPPAPAAGQLPLVTRTHPRVKGEFRRMVRRATHAPRPAASGRGLGARLRRRPLASSTKERAPTQTCAQNACSDRPPPARKGQIPSLVGENK